MKTIVNEEAVNGRDGRGGMTIAARISRLRLMVPTVGVIVATLTACDRKSSETAPVAVMVKALAPEKITLSRRYSGSVEPLQSTSLAFKLSGTVRSLHRLPGLGRDVQVGDTLAKETVIAELEDGDLHRAKMAAAAKVAQLEARVATAKETLGIATRNLQRYESSAGSVSKVARDEAESRRVAAAGELEAAEHALSDTYVQFDQSVDDYENRQLIVPFDRATVAEKNIERGERKAAHEVAFRLIDFSTVYVNFGVPDTMIGLPANGGTPADRIFLGQELLITADAFDGRVLKAKVTKIAPEADPTTRTFLTQLTLANPEFESGQRLLRPGMIVSVLVGANLDREAMLLPMTAVHQGGSDREFTVYEVVSENDRDVVKTRRVTLGGVFNNQVEILPESDVRPGARIAVSTSERMTDGALALVLPESTDPAATLPDAK